MTAHFLVLTESGNDASISNAISLEKLLVERGHSAHRMLRDQFRTELLASNDAILLELGAENDLRWCQEIRQRSRIPLLLFGANANIDIGAKGLAMGADAYLSMSDSWPVLQARLMALLRRLRLTTI